MTTCKDKHDTEQNTSRGTTKSSLLCQQLVQLLVAPLQGQAHRRCPFVVVDAESSSSPRLLEQKPRQPQQTQPHRKMHQCFPRDVLWEETRRGKLNKWEFVGYGLGECHIPPPRNTTHNGWHGADSPKAKEPAAPGKTHCLPISRRDQ